MSFPAYPEYKDSGVAWLGPVPSHWDVGRIKDLFEIRKRIAGELGHDVLSITQRGLRVKDIEGNDGQQAMDYSKYQLVCPGDFAMNHMDLLTGWIDIAAAPGVTSPDYRVFSTRFPDTTCDRFFLRTFQLAYSARQFYPFGQGSSQLGRWRLPSDAFYAFSVAVPPTSEQTAIAAFLDRETAKIDALVAEQERLIALLKEKRRAVISHAVTKGLNPDAPMKDSGIEWLGEVPAHWQLLPLTRVVVQFVDYRGATPTKVDEGVPLITATQIKNGRIDHSLDPVFISEEEYATRMTRGFPAVGDLLLTTEAPLGECALIDDEHVAPGQRIILMKMESELMASSYLHAHFRSQFGQSELWTRASGSTASGIRADRLRASNVLVPPLHEQTAIVEHINDVTAHFEALFAEATRLTQLAQERRAALISAAVTGKIDVRGLADTQRELELA